MLTELVESVRKPDEKVKPMLRETKENVQGTKMYREPIVMRRKLGLRSTVWTRRKKETSNQKRMKKEDFKKTGRGLRTSRTSLNDIQIIGVPEGEEEEQKIENLF